MSKIHDGIMGLVVGDALGVPFEFKPRDTFNATDMVGYGTHNQPPGTWSDDSSMTLVTIVSIALNEEINLHHIMISFWSWLRHGYYTPYGKTFDVGNTTRCAIERYMKDPCTVYECGGKRFEDNGNGSLMRILPLAFFDSDLRDIYNVSSLTHAHRISKMACYIYVTIAKNLMRGVSLHEMLSWSNLFKDEYSNIKNLERLTRDEIKSSGYVVDTLEAALWCILNTDNYKDCVLMAVNLGDDTDTVAAVAGGLAGIMYGIGGRKGIPKKWIKQIARYDDIKRLCDNFEGCVNKHDNK